jgi:hypothetical protein
VQNCSNLLVSLLPCTTFSASKRALTPELALHKETKNPIRNAMLKVLIWFSARATRLAA